MNDLSLGESLQVRASEIYNYCSSFFISNDRDYQTADAKASELNSLAKGIKEFWGPKKSKAYDLWKELCQSEKDMLQPVQDAKKVLTSSMSAFALQRAEVERKRQEELQAQHKVDMALEAMSLDEEGADPVVVQAVAEMGNDAVVVEAQPELRGKTSFSIDYDVKVLTGMLNQIPVELLLPTTPAMVKALEAKVKKLAKLNGGQQVAGFSIVQTQTARTRSA